MGKEEEIRVIAYSIWELGGCCEGRDVEYWLEAETIWEEKQKLAPARRNIKRTGRKAPAKKETKTTKS